MGLYVRRACMMIASVCVLAPAIAGAQIHRNDSLASETVRGTLGTQLDSLLRAYAQLGFSGTVLVVRDERIVLLKGYGFANAEQRTPNRAGTRFEMNSMTKMFTGVSLLQLVGQGSVRLDDAVERYLGEFANAKPGATVRHLALHTAGLVPAGTALASESRDAFVRDVGRARRESEAGTSYRYTNAGYSLLAAIIERASGAPYESYLRQHVFGPAGMHSAIFRTEVPSRDPRFARGYVAGPSGRVLGPPNPYGWGTVGAGGVWCTVGDMYRWVRFVESGQAFPAHLRPLLFSPAPSPSQEAFGWHVSPKTDTSLARIDKGGGSDDFASQLLYYPEERVVVIWASNDLSKRWRRTLNQALPEMLFRGNTAALPPY